MAQKKPLLKKRKVHLQPVATSLPTETRRNLERIAAEEHRNLSQVIRIAIDEFLEARRGPRVVGSAR